MPDEQEEKDPASPWPGFFPRPPYQLRSLPVQFRWEVSRRHPYYDMWWRLASDYYRGVVSDAPHEAAFRNIAVIILRAIGVTGEPPDPRTEFASLEADKLQPAWLSGAAHPISVRGLTSLLIEGCSPETLLYLATKLFDAAKEDKEGEIPRRQQAQLDLSRHSMAELDAFIDEPFIWVNPAASVKQVNESMAKLMKTWKAERGLSPQRDRSDKYKLYLKVWDLREGWSQGVYNRSSELQLKEVARNLKAPIGTVNNHYRSAFELITGQAYSPEMWYLTMGPVKLTELIHEGRGRVSGQRPLKSPSPTPVPESRLMGTQRNAASTLTPLSAAVAPSDDGLNDVVADLQMMIDRGDSNAAIIKSQGFVRPETEAAIEYLRKRGGELP